MTHSQQQLHLLSIEHERARIEAIPRKDRVFCNRSLKMAGITWIGFDMDYTLAIYDQPAMDELSIRATVDKLIARGYPEFIKSVPHLTDYPVRGLLIDKQFGHVLKMDRYKVVCKGYHGLRELTKEELRELYHAKKIQHASARFHWIDTLYALSEVALYAVLTDSLEKHGLAVDYGKLFTDIRESIDEAHRDGTILDEVIADLPRFIRRDPNLASTLHKWRSAGKKFFLLTNSRWSYTDKMMTYLLGGAMSEYPSWRNFFDIVIVAARKPAFFQEHNPLLDREGEKVRPAVFPLERGRIYEGGNFQELELALNVPGDEVLYVGDHIYGDILRSKKQSTWRTAMIIQELETEIAAHEACRNDYARTEELETLHEQLEHELRFYQARFKELQKTSEREDDPDKVRAKSNIERIRQRFREVNEEWTVLQRRIDLAFHRYWGSLMKEDTEQSIFGQQIEDYACVYTSRVSNFLNYSAQQSFRSPRDEMAHEFGV